MNESVISPDVPRVSIVIPTLNSGRSLRACLQSIREQSYPRERVEIVVADAGSTDETLAIAREFGVDRVVGNPLKTGEAGKSEAIKASSGEIIALIDSDNILDSPDWLTRMIAPFADPDMMASEPLSYTHRATDPALTRYFALLGMNDPLCLFLGNYDRWSLITGKWTDLSVRHQECGDYLKLTLERQALPTIGANGFVFRRSLLDTVQWSPYFFDIDVVAQAIESGHPHVAKVKCGIVHLYSRTLRDFARKQDRRIRDFLHFSEQRQRLYPWQVQSRAGIVRFCLYTVCILPLLAQILRGASRRPDRAWLYHVPVCWITLWVYGINSVAKAMGLRRGPKSRQRWQA